MDYISIIFVELRTNGSIGTYGYKPDMILYG